MKKVILLVCGTLIFTASFGQFKGIENVTIISGDADLKAKMKYEVWFQRKISDGYTIYSMFFATNPVAVKHAVTKTVELCILNGFDFNNPSIDDTLLPVYVKTISDFSSVSLGLETNSCEINKSWKNPKYLLTLHLVGKLGIIMVILEPEKK
jgi:hypothetical protein